MNIDVKLYILRESTISMIFNAAFSLGFAWLMFRGSDAVVKQKVIIDALPQSFFVAFFGTLIPTLVTHRRIRSGSLAVLPRRDSRLPVNVFVRAVAMGLIASIVGIVLHALVLHGSAIDQLQTRTVLVYKPLYGALLTWVVTPFALLVALTEARESR